MARDQVVVKDKMVWVLYLRKSTIYLNKIQTQVQMILINLNKIKKAY
jgi:hypothetical protein